MRRDGGLLGDRTRLTLGAQPSIARDTWTNNRRPCGALEAPAVINSNSSPKILFVDDDPNITRSLWRRFKSVGIEVIRSHNAKEGLVLAMTERPDVILTDHNMPGITGERFIMNLRYNHMTKHIPVIMITGVTFHGKEDFALKRQVLGRGGAVSFLSKPIDFQSLLEALRGHIKLPAQAEII